MIRERIIEISCYQTGVFWHGIHLDFKQHCYDLGIVAFDYFPRHNCKRMLSFYFWKITIDFQWGRKRGRKP